MWIIQKGQATDSDLPDTLREVLSAAEDGPPDSWLDKQECFRLLGELEKHLLECAKELPRTPRRARQKQSIRDADITRMRQRLARIKRRWGWRSSRRALESAMATHQSVLDRARMPVPLQERLKQLTERGTDSEADRAAAITTLNAAIKFLGRARSRAAAKRLQATIHSAVLRRCEQFQTNVGAVLRSLKRGATLPNTGMDRALSPTPTAQQSSRPTRKQC